MKTVGITDPVLTARKIRRSHLIEIQAGRGSATYYRYTDNNVSDIVITIDAVIRTFVRRSFSISNVVSDLGGMQNTEVAFLDIDQALQAIGLSFDMKDWPVTIWEVFFNDDGSINGTEMLIGGMCDGIEFQVEGQVGRATLGILSSDLPEQGTGPRREYTVECDFRYKDEQCAAVSVLTTCNRTLNDCIARNNQARFGGFPYAPKPGAKFKWGVFEQIINSRPVWSGQD